MIHPVQKIIDDPTQLSGRGVARIFHMKLVLSQRYVFVVLQTGSRAVKFEIWKFRNFENTHNLFFFGKL